MDKYERFKEDVYRLTGINLSFYKEKQMKRRIQSLVTRNNYRDFDDYFVALKLNKDLFNEFINYLTINVSEFYRNPGQWEVLERELIPILLDKGNNITVWSSACSTGEEPYSLVMLLSKFLDLSKIRVIATDIDMGAIEKAKIGIYSEKSLDNLPKDLKVKYFEKIGNSYKISEKIKACVSFKKLNLLEDRYPQNNDLILCRNVMIYFTEDAKVKMYEKFHNALSAQGVFFVGSTEQIILPERYNLKPIKTFFYKKNS